MSHQRYIPDRQEIARLPRNGRFYGGESSSTSDAVLPSYGDGDVSAPAMLALTDCHDALQATIRKARLIGFEIARTQRSFSALRISQGVVLQGEPRLLDESLSGFSEMIITSLDVIDVATPSKRVVGVSTETPFQRLLCANNTFKQSNDQLKRSLLRIEKIVIQNVIEPLKHSLIHENIPPFAKMMESAEKCQADVRTAAQIRQTEVRKAAAEVEAAAPWQELLKSVETFQDLKEEAEAFGWDQWQDRNFVKLEYYSMFDRADGPSSVIKYLEQVVQDKGKTNSDPPLATNSGVSGPSISTSGKPAVPSSVPSSKSSSKPSSIWRSLIKRRKA